MKKWKNQPPTDRFLSTRTRETREVLTKLKMGTQRGQMNGVLSWLVRWAGPAGTRLKGYCSDLAALVGPVQNIFFHTTLFQFLCPHRPASWAGSRAGPPISQCVSLKLSPRTLFVRHMSSYLYLQIRRCFCGQLLVPIRKCHFILWVHSEKFEMDLRYSSPSPAPSIAISFLNTV